MSAHFDALIAWFEHLTPSTLEQIGDYYAPAARFKDPFNDLAGIANVRRVYAHMFDSLEAPRFVVENRIEQGAQAFLVWRFEFGLRGRAMCIRGGSHMVLDEQGRIALHRDYWDAAEELYEHLPVLGGVLRLLKRRLAI
jgi:hypothetical protein